ncbi:hypothetical protein SUDANB180_07549 [Streptomyces sp. enrichment culture]
MCGASHPMAVNGTVTVVRSKPVFGELAREPAGVRAAAQVSVDVFVLRYCLVSHVSRLATAAVPVFRDHGESVRMDGRVDDLTDAILRNRAQSPA